MSQQIRLFMLSLLIMGVFSSCKGQGKVPYAEAQRLRKEMDDWMKTYRREQFAELEQWADWVVNHIDSLWAHPVFKHMETFFKQHRSQYLHLRKADLKRYGKAPALPDYERVPDFYGPYEDKSFPIEKVLNLSQRVGNFRTLGVADTRFVIEVLSGYTLEYLKAEKHLSIEQVMNKRMYGERFFVDPQKPDQWKITVVNRLYALKYSWNINDNQISHPELWVYTGSRQSPGWLGNLMPVSQTPLQQLDSRLGLFRWALYDEPDMEVEEDKKKVSKVTERLTAYYQAHQKDYIRLRSKELAKFPPLDEAYAKAFNGDGSELKEDLLSVLEKHQNRYSIPAMIVPYESCGTYIVHNFRYMLMMHRKDYAEYALISWITGEDIYTRQMAENVWEIRFFYHKYAVCFQWNIATDEISSVAIKTKENS